MIACKAGLAATAAFIGAIFAGPAALAAETPLMLVESFRVASDIEAALKGTPQ